MTTAELDNVGLPLPYNAAVADQFVEAAELLEAQGADPFRVQAYRRAAGTMRRLDHRVDEIYRAEGIDGLVALPGVGNALARAVADIVDLGRWRWLDRLRGDVDPEAVLATVAGVGPRLAARVHHELGIERLEELEAAAHDGRLARLPGFGDKRVRAIAESLDARLRLSRTIPVYPPVIDELLDVDAEYRERVAAGTLTMLAPRRFNPTGERWLPILHTHRGERHYTALYSNTARAHRLDRVADWVVIHCDEPGDGQWTVVTETHGPLTGRRVVRGHEAECELAYERAAAVDRTLPETEPTSVVAPRRRTPPRRLRRIETAERGPS